MSLTVAGIGSLFRQDDAIGIKLVQALSFKEIKREVTTLFWENADVLTLTNNLLETETPLLIVDCVDMKREAGCCHFFSSDDYSLKNEFTSLSDHGPGFAQALELAKELGLEGPVHIFGVQPFGLSPLPGLTPKMEEKFPEILKYLSDKITEIV